MAELSPATKSAYRMFSTWRRDVLNAGFAARGKPLKAYRALDAIVMGSSSQLRTALERAESALLEWSAGNESVRDTCAPVLKLVQGELQTMA